MLDDEEVDAPAGTFVYCPPGTLREAHAVEPETTVVAFGAKPGVPHEPSPWEEIFVAYGHLRNGNEAEGRKYLDAAVAARPDEWEGHYHAACFDALTGNKEAAIRHLRRAAELDPKALEWAQEDEDFDEIRNDPEFPA